jgi:hypothetical protein
MVLAAVAVAMCGTTLMPAHGAPTAFPPSAITDQDKIDWLTAEAGRAAQAVDAEAESRRRSTGKLSFAKTPSTAKGLISRL